mgnify:CR=1 FL=1
MAFGEEVIGLIFFFLGFVNCLIAYADVNAIDYMNILEFVGKFLLVTWVVQFS